MADTDTRRAIEAVWRIESARVVAGVARLVRDVGLAENLAQDALVAALEQWPESGVPAQPRCSDGHNRKAPCHRSHPPAGGVRARLAELGHELEVEALDATDPAVTDLDGEEIEDDLLRLIFVSCHPVRRRGGGSLSRCA